MQFLKIYLYNDNCKISNVDSECMNVNCTTIYEFDYELINDEVNIYVGEINLEKNNN
jgi:hypothetical protein